jgi:hypothetical protein
MFRSAAVLFNEQLDRDRRERTIKYIIRTKDLFTQFLTEDMIRQHLSVKSLQFLKHVETEHCSSKGGLELPRLIYKGFLEIRISGSGFERRDE